jgi:DNA-binding transcriptional ArsR family regulator
MARKKSTPRPAEASHYKVGRLDQVRVMAHPLRLRMLGLFGEKPRTTKQVAESLGEKPTRLYHHVDAMVRVGLIELVSTKQNRGATEKYYRAVARRFEVGRHVFESEGEAAAESGTQAMLRTVIDAARSEAYEYFDRPNRKPPVPPLIARAVVYGDDDEIREVLEKLNALIAGLKRDEKKGDGEPKSPTRAYVLSLFFHPWPREESEG